MTRIKKFFLLFHLLNKRILKRYSFLIILGIVPLLTAGMFLAAKEDSGVLHIVLCQENPEDELSGRVLQELLDQQSILRYTRAESTEEARQSVESGNADAAWIFLDEMQEKLDAGVASGGDREPLLMVVEREDSVFLQLARERLYGELYSHLSYSMYKDYCLELLEGKDISEEKLREEYETIRVEEGLFLFAYAGETREQAEETNYLLTPLRGMLALLILLCGLTGSLFYQQDKEKRLFECMPVGNRKLFPYLYHAPAVANASAVVLITLLITGMWVGTAREVGILLLYGTACIGFCNLIRKLCRNLQGLAVCIPLLLCAMLVICPIFISLRSMRLAQFLFPPFYYLQALHDMNYLKYMIGYIIIVYGIDWMLAE